MCKFALTGCGFAKKGSKLLRHYGTKSNYGSKKECHSELVSESHREQTLKQVQGDNVFVYGDNPCVIARSETTKQYFLKGAKLLRHYGTKLNLPLPTGEVDFVSERSEFTKSGEGTIFKVLNGTKSNCHAELVSASVRGETLKRVQGDNPCVIASVQRNVAIASNRDLREQNTECAVRRCNDAVGAVPIHSKACFLFSFGTFLISLIAKRKRKVHGKTFKRDCFASLAMTGQKAFAFTLSEVLIVLAVLGVVAAIVIPDLVQDARDMAFKTAYKKAYRDVNEAYDLMKVNDEDFEEIECVATESCPDCCYSTSFENNFKLLSKQFKVTKTCFSNNLTQCWECEKGQTGAGTAPDYYGCAWGANPAFIDNSGRAWTMYYAHEAPILVDTNGFAGPNELGQDRWRFYLPTPKSISTNQGLIVPEFNNDVTTKWRYCPRGDCKYRSWLK